MDDKEMILLIRENPSEGIRVAIDKYAPLIKMIVKRILYKSEEDVEECVSDSFVKLWETIDTLDPDDSNIKAYLACIARNLAINRYNYIKKRETETLDDISYSIPDKTNIEDEVLQSFTSETILEVFEKLPEPNREIMLRKFFFFEPVKQIAEKLGMTDASVASRIQHTKGKLGEMLLKKGVTL